MSYPKICIIAILNGASALFKLAPKVITSVEGQGYGYNDTAHKQAVTHLDGAQKFWYDTNGNMTKRIEGSVTYNQGFDVENRLVSVTPVGGTATTFAYDASGQRVKTAEPGGKTTYLPFANYEETVVGSSTIKRSSYLLAGQVVAFRVAGDPVTTNNGLFFIYGDHLGSTTMLGTSGGAFVAGSLTRYRPFGSYRTAPTQTLTDRDFTGQRENREIGLLYYNARFYMPEIGRFASADTLIPNPANPQSYNRYTYVENRPVNLIDPSGHCASTALPDGSFTRSEDDVDCWEQYDSLVARFTKAGHSAQWILNRIGSGAGYKFKDMGIVRVQDTYVNCGRDFDCSKGSEGSRRKNQYYQEQSCQPWDNCYTPVFDGDWGVELGTPIGAYEFNTGGNSINFGTDAGGCMPGAWVCGGAGPESQISTDSWETSTGVNLFAGLGVGGEVGNIGVGIWGGTEVTTISNQPELTVSYSNLIHAEFAGFSIELNYTPSEFR